jgi:hypothetical protein
MISGLDRAKTVHIFWNLVRKRPILLRQTLLKNLGGVRHILAGRVPIESRIDSQDGALFAREAVAYLDERSCRIVLERFLCAVSFLIAGLSGKIADTGRQARGGG